MRPLIPPVERLRPRHHPPFETHLREDADRYNPCKPCRWPRGCETCPHGGYEPPEIDSDVDWTIDP